MLWTSVSKDMVMGKIKELMEDLFNKKMGDYQTRTLNTTTGDNSFFPNIREPDPYVPVRRGYSYMDEPDDMSPEWALAIKEAREQIIKQQDLIGQCPIVHIPTPNDGTICLPSGTKLDQDAIDEAMNTHTRSYQASYSPYKGVTYSNVAGGYVDGDGNRCDEYGNPLSTLDENGWRRE